MPPGLDSLKHIVVLMMENRSFDHMLGSLKAKNPDIDGYIDSDPFTNLDANNNPVKPQALAEFQGQLDPDPDHPTGQALCAKGRAAPELVYSRDRLTAPLLRTNPKSAPDPGWRPISWDEALNRTASAVRRIIDEDGRDDQAFTRHG